MEFISIDASRTDLMINRMQQLNLLFLYTNIRLNIEEHLGALCHQCVFLDRWI